MLPARLQEGAWDRLPTGLRAGVWTGASAVSARLWERLDRGAQAALWERLGAGARQQLLWPEGPPRTAWHSFDRHPWLHPWLTPENLRSFRAFSDEWIERVLQAVGPELDRPGRRYAFVCNMANNLYSRGKAMRSRPVDIAYFPHPEDRYLMSHPEWEEYEGEAFEGIDSIDAARTAGMPLPQVPGVHRLPVLEQPPADADLPPALPLLERERWRAFFRYLPTIRAAADCDARLAMQSPYLAYLTGKPYVVTQMGGDIWYECSRDDLQGRLQRVAFRQAGAFLVSNPWSLAFARRYGLRNMVYVPYLVDQERYSPGEPACREAWKAASGGDFFVLMTSRQDYRFKGSDVAVRGFARFAASVPGARLVVTAWGADREKVMALFREQGIAGKVLLLPIVGKKRLVSYLRSADCVLDQISTGYFGSSGLEAMSCGRPVVMKLDRGQYGGLLHEGCAPVCQATNEEEVASHLRRLHADPQARAAVGQGLREWVLATHDNRKWARVYDAILAASALGRLPDFAGSPLERPCDTAELAYHASELAAAPEFPNYF